MTPLTKKRHSTARQGKRRASIKLTLPTLVACSNCHKPTRSHAACSYCHFYKGQKVG
ncbi:50S ribosomal protein L32 [Candidatus Amesbacteria bacterium RIFOXYB1_FULL_44_23]|uniref:Large ribosomal subunit protein bL32 n=1 Tax=Candidatus Amesbacteria bacterium RIFOXYB1_FULL_44_23 TaxID=1797263 RepID=A0A1F4ZWF5_9BACT|nr:MAG: 50S ribosomal protein L32 [Candidatus Amesbacteria bacterium RIFOXYB1_FULL_44_23]